MEQKIVPCIWCGGNADELVAFYLSVFPNSEKRARTYYPTEGVADFQRSMAGEVLTVDFAIGGFRITALNGGPEFTPSPMLSFIVNYDPSREDDARDQLDRAWNKLVKDGKVLMELGEYPFSKHYGWVQDKFGVSWQLMLTNPEGEPRPFLIPSLMYANDNVNKAAEALEYYSQTFGHSRIGTVARYPEAQGEVAEGSVMFGEFSVGDQWFAVMDSPTRHEFDFNEGVSLQVECDDQGEIDMLWGRLSAVPDAEQCGWCKDQYGVSWQIVPRNMERLLTPQNFKTMLAMKKIVIADLRR
jgi:predicted 3-demethylubiquinone-9 3-methyltransferase (glyoxalase superfamily)